MTPPWCYTGGMAEVMTVRMRSDVATYVARLADSSGLSMAAVIETLIDEARRRGWTVEPRRGAVVENP